jgi:hypothetical protein
LFAIGGHLVPAGAVYGVVPAVYGFAALALELRIRSPAIARRRAVAALPSTPRFPADTGIDREN